jgi:hypothetical protein
VDKEPKSNGNTGDDTKRVKFSPKLLKDLILFICELMGSKSKFKFFVIG